jgi:hypothetical protein
LPLASVRKSLLKLADCNKSRIEAEKITVLLRKRVRMEMRKENRARIRTIGLRLIS